MCDVSYYLTFVSIAFKKEMWKTTKDMANYLYDPRYANDCAHMNMMHRPWKLTSRVNRLNINTYEINKIITFLIFFDEIHFIARFIHILFLRFVTQIFQLCYNKRSLVCNNFVLRNSCNIFNKRLTHYESSVTFELFNSIIHILFLIFNPEKVIGKYSKVMQKYFLYSLLV